jgi:hypothetical protein
VELAPEARVSAALARAERSLVPGAADSPEVLAERAVRDRAVLAMVTVREAALEQEEAAFGKFRAKRGAEPAAVQTRRAAGATPRQACGEEADPRGAVRARWPWKPD